MPVVGELFGFPFGSPESFAGISEAKCPFTQARCDGGGNRDMANVALANDSGLRSRFSGNVIKSGSVSCAICSVGMSGSLKIICPRRLLNFGPNGFSTQHLELIRLLCHTAGFSKGAQIDFWSEISLSFKHENLKFQYRLDYLLREVLPNGEHGAPIIVEIMTCSTSGGNKSLGTDIQTAFRKALLANQGDRVDCPGINIRQVWARMASQLIVKSEAALAWGGKTIWVVQDTLTNYMENNTGLRLGEMQSGLADEVNIIAASSDVTLAPKLYSGPISSALNTEPSFSDILKAPFLPNMDAFLNKVRKPPTGSFIVPSY